MSMQRLLDEVGVRVLRYQERRDTLGPGDTYAIRTIETLCERYGDLVVKKALTIIQQSNHPGEMCAETISAFVDLVRISPLWVEDMQKIIAVVSKVDLTELRLEAKATRGNGILLALLCSEIAQQLGAQR